MSSTHIRGAFVAPRSPWPWIALALLAFLPYAGTLGNPLVLDDWNLIVNNRLLVHPHAVRAIFTSDSWAFRASEGVSNFYRPMQHFFYWAVYQAAGPRPAWFHLGCVLLHVAITLMVFALLLRIEKCNSDRAATEASGRFCRLREGAVPGRLPRINRQPSLAVALLGAALFALHPLHTEAVAWIACIPDLLCTLFLLAAFLLYLKARDTAGWQRVALDAAMAISLLLAMLSKETAVLLLALMPLYDCIALRAGRSAGERASLLTETRRLFSRWPEYAAMVAAAAVYFAARVSVIGALMPVSEHTSYTAGDRLFTSIALFYRYLLFMLWPVPLNLLREDAPNRSLLEPPVVAGLLALSAVAALGVWLYRNRRIEALGVPLYVLLLLPVFSLPYLKLRWLLLERSAYAPSIAFCWLLAAGLIALAERGAEAASVTEPVSNAGLKSAIRKAGVPGAPLFARWGGSPQSAIRLRLAAFLTVLILAGYAVRTVLRVRDWNDELYLVRQGVERAPDSYYLKTYYADVAIKHGRIDQAVDQLQQALHLREDYSEAHNLLGQALFQLNQPEPAVQHYRRAAELCLRDGEPYSAARVWNNIGVVYRSLGRNGAAIEAYRRALDYGPRLWAARNNLGYALLIEGRIADAIEQLEQTAQGEPTLGQAWSNLGVAYASAGRVPDAARAFSEAERINPYSGEVQARIGQFEMALGRPDQARRRFERALVLEPGNQRARAGLAALQGGR